MTSSSEVANKPVALVLGAIVNHIILIKKLQKRGFYVVVVDYLDNPPAKACADEHAQISTFDEEAIEKLAVERGACLIINANLEHVNAIAIRVSEKLGLPVPYSSEVALNVSDKQRMKTIMKSGGVPTTDFCCISSIEEFKEGDLSFPVFVKPVDGSGSTAVNRASNFEELEHCISLACKASARGRAIVEEEAQGKECSVYAFVSNGVAYVLLTAQKLIEAGDGESLTRCMATLAPMEMNPKAERAIHHAAQSIVDAFGFVNAPMFMQVKVDKDEINVIEFAGRLAGGYSYRTIEITTDFDVFEGTIDAFLGQSVEVPTTSVVKHLAICSILGDSAVFGGVAGVEELINEGILLDFLQVRHFGVKFSNEKANSQRAGFALLQGSSKAELVEKMEKCFERLRILDEMGNDITLPNTSLQLMNKVPESMALNVKRITTPVTRSDLEQLQVGDVVLLSGPLFTGRDAALPSLVNALQDGTYNGPSIKGAAVLHTAVSPAGIGPTSSNKLEIESSILPLSAHGLILHIGKGALKQETVKGLAEHGALFAVTPPVTALFNSNIDTQEVVFRPELGMEAMNLLTVHDFPLIVAAAKGVSIYDERA